MRRMIPALLMLLAPTHLEYRAISPGYCPANAIGYVHPIKDAYIIAGGAAKWDDKNERLTAWFGDKGSGTEAGLVWEPLKNSIRVTAGSIRIRHGTLCAFSVP